jgi:hypothetical protein
VGITRKKKEKEKKKNNNKEGRQVFKVKTLAPKN